MGVDCPRIREAFKVEQNKGGSQKVCSSNFADTDHTLCLLVSFYLSGSLTWSERGIETDAPASVSMGDEFDGGAGPASLSPNGPSERYVSFRPNFSGSTE